MYILYIFIIFSYLFIGIGGCYLLIRLTDEYVLIKNKPSGLLFILMWPIILWVLGFAYLMSEIEFYIQSKSRYNYKNE